MALRWSHATGARGAQVVPCHWRATHGQRRDSAPEMNPSTETEILHLVICTEVSFH
jgi:hypothetical protein